MKNKYVNTLLIAFLLSLSSFSSTTFAATTAETKASVTVEPGVLSITEPDASVNFGTITIDGTIKKPTASLSDMTISDFRGSGDGWKVTVQASQFQQTNGTQNLSLKTGILNIKPGITITSNGNTNTPPVSVLTSDSVIDSGASVEIIQAAASAGQGTWIVDFPVNSLELNVDTSSGVLVESGVNPTVYESTIVWTVVTGP